MTSRPLTERSEIVQDLYADISELKPVIGEIILFDYPNKMK